MQNFDEILDVITEKTEAYARLSDEIWAMPELGFQEKRSSAAQLAQLEAEGFKITRNLAGIPTAFVGETGDEGPVIAILGEFDALPGLSQQAGMLEHSPVEQDGNGHGCGHNMLGAGSMLAAAALKEWVENSGKKARIRYYGCPAEESGSGKSFLVRAGVFDDVDIALCWHPAAFTGVNPPKSLACTEMEFTFIGRSAHAAVAPHLGRSALDAMEMMHIGINYIREHMLSSSRVHYAIIDSGGKAPNVVQSRVVNRVMVRATTLQDMTQLVERIRKIASGAAIMSETTVTDRVLAGEANLVGNEVLEEVMDNVIRRLGAPAFDAQDREFATSMQTTFSKQDIAASYHRYSVKPQVNEPLCEQIFPLGAGATDAIGSTDVGSVSWVVPTVQCRVACYAVGTPGHSWQLVAQGQAPAAHKGLAHAAKIMACTVRDVLTDPALFARVVQEHKDYRALHDFSNPVGDDLDMASTLASNELK